MRPVNLIPSDQRRGENAPLRTGPLPYVLVGALVLVLVGVTALVLTGNQISEREDEVATAEARRRGRHRPCPAPCRLYRVPGDERTADRDRDQPRRQPLRLGAGDARTGARPAQRRLAGHPRRHGDRERLHRRRWRRCPAAGGGAGAGPGDRGLRPRPGGRCRLRHDAEGHRRGDPGRRRVLRTSQQRRRGAAAAARGGEDCRTRDFIAKFSIVVAFDAAPVPLATGDTAPVSAPEEAEVASSKTEESSEESAGEG